MSRNPRRAYNKDGRKIPPAMANIREEKDESGRLQLV
jgi:hypothetical protein